MTAAYWPARLGEFAWLSPRAPWHIVQRSARVAPRPIDSALAPCSISDVTMTPLVLYVAGTTGSEAGASRTRPAALQMAFHTPWMRPPASSDGNQMKPTAAAATAMQAVIATLAVNQRSRSEKTLHSLIVQSRP